MVAAVHLDELHGDAQAVAGLAHAAFEDVSDAEPLADRAHVESDIAELERRGARGDAQAGDAAEGVEDLLGDAVAEVLLVAPGGEVAERQDGDRRRFRGSRRGGVRRRGQGLEVEGEVGRRLVAVLGALRQAAPHQPRDLRRQAERRRGEIRRLLAQDGGEGVGRGLALEGALAGQQLVDHGAEGEDVGAGVGRQPARLLGRHVAGGAEERAGERAGDGGRGGGRLGRAHLGEPEVEDLEVPVAGQEEVLGLEVAVHDAARVRGGDAAGELQRPAERGRGRRPAGAQPVAQRLAFEQLADQERRALVAAEVVDGEDVGVVERRRGARLALEPLQPLGVPRHLRRQHLDRHLPPQPPVARPVDLPHPPGPERRQDLVGTEPAAGGEAHGREPTSEAASPP